MHNGLFFAFGYYLYRHQDSLLPLYANNCWRYSGGADWRSSSPRWVVYEAFLNNGARPAVRRARRGFPVPLRQLAVELRPDRPVHALPAGAEPLPGFVADSSYWVYLVHFPVTVGFGVLLYEAPYGALAKMGINLAATTAVCLLTLPLLVRYTPVSTLLNGRAIPCRCARARLPWPARCCSPPASASTQIKFDANEAPTRTSAAGGNRRAGRHRPLSCASSAMPTAARMAPPWRNSCRRTSCIQGMDRAAFLDHLQKNRQYFGKLKITPVGIASEHPDHVELSAYGISAKGVLAPSLQLLPLQAGATLVQEDGKWKLHGNQRYDEASLYRQVRMSWPISRRPTWKPTGATCPPASPCRNGPMSGSRSPTGSAWARRSVPTGWRN